MAGARWVANELLAKNPTAEVRVSAVWFNMLGSDTRTKWRLALLDDPRVVHFWDEGKVLGRFYVEHLDYDDEVLWDAYILYGPEASWKGEPSQHISWGRTVVRTRSQLERDFRQLVKPAEGR